LPGKGLALPSTSSPCRQGSHLWRHPDASRQAWRSPSTPDRSLTNDNQQAAAQLRVTQQTNTQQLQTTAELTVNNLTTNAVIQLLTERTHGQPRQTTHRANRSPTFSRRLSASNRRNP